MINVSVNEFKHRFSLDPHPFISEKFIDLNKNKAGKIVRLIEDKPKVGIGLIAGITGEILQAPFSAPFGGFHYKNERILISEIEQFLEKLLNYSKHEGIKRIHITLPPSIYQKSINAKVVNAMIRKGFDMGLPDITHWINLKKFDGKIPHKKSWCYRRAIENDLEFVCLLDREEKRLAYEVICENRACFGRPIYMTYDDLINTSELWAEDFFCVKTLDGKIIASAIFYQFPKGISYGVFLGDIKSCRPLRAMDFLVYNLLIHYKSKGFEYIDFGTSTKLGKPNQGLLRFKETHGFISDLRFSFSKII